MKNTSIRKNLIFNVLKTVASIAFPLITYPYAARTLLPEGLGKINYAISIVSCFQVIASLGINTYAISEGSKIRDNYKQLNQFAVEILLINIMSTTIAYGCMLFFYVIDAFSGYECLICIQASSIIFNTIGVSWLFNIYEDFKYITIRSVIFQLISILLMLKYVKGPEDVYTYAMLNVFSSVGSNVLNLICARKYINFFNSNLSIINIFKHLKPIMLLFASSAASAIYMNSDRIIIKYYKGDVEVGYYSAAMKVISVVTVSVMALRDVVLPRISYYIGKNDKKGFADLVTTGLCTIYLIVIPGFIGSILLSEEIVIFLFSEIYEIAAASLSILSFELLLAPVNGFLAYQILVPYRKTVIVSNSTVISAFCNITLNFFFVPIWGGAGAAITTVVSEMLVFFLLLYKVKSYYNYKLVFKDIIQYIIASFIMAALIIVLKKFLSGNRLLFVSIFTGAVSYFIILGFMKNNTLYTFFNMRLILDYIKKRRNQ